MNTQLVISWLIGYMIIMLYGYYEIEFTKKLFRWHILSSWLLLGLLTLLYRIWL